MGTVPQNMSPTTDPGATSLLSTLLPSLMLASSRVTGTEHDPGDAVKITIEKIEITEMDQETINSEKKSVEKILSFVQIVEIVKAFIEDTCEDFSYLNTLAFMILLSGSGGHQCAWAAGGTYDLCQLNLFNNIQQGKFEWLDNNNQTALVTPANIRNVEALPSYLACSILLCFLLFPSLSENKKYQAIIDCHESCHLQTSAMSKVFSDKIQTFEI